jgi:transposase
MWFSSATLRIFLYPKPIDMRAGFERLSYYVREHFQAELASGHLYLFLGGNRRRAKVLYFDGTGLVLCVKRLEEGIFLEVKDLQAVQEITVGELSLILSGNRIRYSLASRGKARTCVTAEKVLE